MMVKIKNFAGQLFLGFFATYLIACAIAEVLVRFGK